MPRSRALLALRALFAAVVVASPLTFGIAGVPGASPPDTITESGDAINNVYWVVYALAAGVFILIELTLIVFVFRFRRRRPGAPLDGEGPQIHGNTRVEVIWTTIPALLLLALAIYTFSQVPNVNATPKGDERADVLRVDVTAHQFYWQYRYPNGALSYDTLYLPVDRKATLVINSADVDHSWWVPELTGKKDAIPGQTNELHFTPRKPGEYRNGVCGEFCGIQHARMTTRVLVLGATGFQAWLRRNAPATTEDGRVALGEQEWTAACAKCHGLEGEGDIGPPIAGNGTLVNAKGLRDLLYDGQNLDANPGYMPPVGKGWTDEQIAALIAYVKSNSKLGVQGGR